MALTENRDVPLGTPCPDFRLPTVDGNPAGLEFADRNAQLAAEYLHGLLTDVTTETVAKT